MTAAGRPVVFIHGLWLHATSWGPWTELFQTAGYLPLAPGWPGEPDTVEESRNHPELVAGTGIDDAVEHYAQIIRGLDAPPVVIGHSFGGLIGQRESRGPLCPDHPGLGPPAGRDRPLLRRPDRPAAARRKPRGRGSG